MRLPTRGPHIDSRWVEVEGLRAHLLEAGEGPVLVLLASMLVRGRSYLPVLRRLAAHFRVVVVELPGSGRSARLRRPWTLVRYARWTARMLEQLRLEQVVVVGHSNSGAVALLLGALRGGRVAGLVLADTIGARDKRTLPRVLSSRAWDALHEWRLNLKAWWHLVYNLLRHTRNFLNQVRLSSHANLLHRVHCVRMPVLLAWGRKDHTMPLAGALRLQARMPRARVYVGGGSHDWIITDPDEFTRAVVAFTSEGEERRMEEDLAEQALEHMR